MNSSNTKNNPTVVNIYNYFKSPENRKNIFYNVPSLQEYLYKKKLSNYQNTEKNKRFTYVFLLFLLLVILCIIYGFTYNKQSPTIKQSFIVSLVFIFFILCVLLLYIKSDLIEFFSKSVDQTPSFNLLEAIQANILPILFSLSSLGIMAFLMFCLLYLNNPDVLKNTSNTAKLWMMLGCIIGIMFLGLGLFFSLDGLSFSQTLKQFIYLILVLFIIGFFSYLLYVSINNISSNKILSIILNIVIFIVVFGLVFQLILKPILFPTKKPTLFSYEEKNNKSKSITFLLNITKKLSEISGVLLSKIKEFFTVSQDDFKYIGLLVVILSIYGLYYFVPKYIVPLFQSQGLKGGKVLLEKSLPLNISTTLSSYHDLLNLSTSEIDPFTYQYSLSSWFYLEANAPNTNESYTRYTTIWNFGEKPLIQYKASTNSLRVVVQTEKKDKVVYVKHNVLLQKWNHLVINYSGGTLDIFLNNKLVKSIPSLVPYMTYDSIVVGKDGGLNGKIKKVVFFNAPISLFEINSLYYSNV